MSHSHTHQVSVNLTMFIPSGNIACSRCAFQGQKSCSQGANTSGPADSSAAKLPPKLCVWVTMPLLEGPNGARQLP